MTKESYVGIPRGPDGRWIALGGGKYKNTKYPDTVFKVKAKKPINPSPLPKPKVYI